MLNVALPQQTEEQKGGMKYLSFASRERKILRNYRMTDSMKKAVSIWNSYTQNMLYNMFIAIFAPNCNRKATQTP